MKKKFIFRLILIYKKIRIDKEYNEKNKKNLN